MGFDPPKFVVGPSRDFPGHEERIRAHRARVWGMGIMEEGRDALSRSKQRYNQGYPSGHCVWCGRPVWCCVDGLQRIPNVGLSWYEHYRCGR